MKLKLLAASLALAGPFCVQAQPANVAGTSVTLYGTIDTAIEYVNNIGVDKHSSVQMPTNTASFPSNWGLRGSEDLGNNLKAVFQLESGFAPSTGASNQGGRLFGRQAWVGLRGDWGQVAFGRQYNMLFWALGKSDLIGPNSFGLAAFDEYIPNARMDNSITYRGTFSGFTVGMAYTRGRDTVRGGGPGGLGNPAAGGCGVNYTSQSDCSGWSAMLGYDASNWGVAAGYDQINGGGVVGGGAPGTSAPSFAPNSSGPGYLASGQKDRRATLNGYVKFNDFKFGGGYIYRKNDGGSIVPSGALNPARDNHRSDLWFINAAYAASPSVTVDGALYHIRLKDLSEKATYYLLRSTYSLSKRTAVYAAVAHVSNGGNLNYAVSGGSPGTNPAAGNNQTGVMAGLRHRF